LMHPVREEKSYFEAPHPQDFTALLGSN
jgi:hypothetical protein